MIEQIDHVAEATQHIAWAHEQQEREGDMGNVPRDDALLAQVHATLALVEQQRIANLIAFYNVSPDDAGVLITAGVSFAEVLRQIREGLGL